MVLVKARLDLEGNHQNPRVKHGKETQENDSLKISNKTTKPE